MDDLFESSTLFNDNIEEILNNNTLIEEEISRLDKENDNFVNTSVEEDPEEEPPENETDKNWGTLINDLHKDIFQTSNHSDLIHLEKAKYIEEIDRLQHRIQEFSTSAMVTMDVPDGKASIDELRFYLAILRERYGKLQFSTTAGDILTGAAYIMEDYFDGSKSIIGTDFNPNYTGYAASVQSKISDIKYNMSEIVNRFFTKYTLGPVWQIGFELLSSLIFFPILNKGGTRYNNPKNSLSLIE